MQERKKRSTDGCSCCHNDDREAGLPLADVGGRSLVLPLGRRYDSSYSRRLISSYVLASSRLFSRGRRM